MDAGNLFASVTQMNQIKTKVREFAPGLRLTDGAITAIENLDDRVAVIAETLKIESNIQLLSDPLTTYKEMTEAGQEVAKACRRLCALALEWENFDLQLAVRRLEEVSDEIVKLVFHSDLWDDLKKG